MRNLILVLSLGLLLGAAGCVLPGEPSAKNLVGSANVSTLFEESLDAIGNDLQAESDVRAVAADLTDQISTAVTTDYVYPIQTYSTHRTSKVFGQYIAPDAGDRFSGYHTGDDVEVDDINASAAVYAITGGTMIRRQTVPGYGGVVILKFSNNDITYHALYGHLDLDSVGIAVGEQVVAGQQLGLLGEDKSADTDGERKHLHFAIYPYTGTEQFAGYVDTEADIAKWIDPAAFLKTQSARLPDVNITTDDISEALKQVKSN